MPHQYVRSINGPAGRLSAPGTMDRLLGIFGGTVLRHCACYVECVNEPAADSFASQFLERLRALPSTHFAEPAVVAPSTVPLRTGTPPTISSVPARLPFAFAPPFADKANAGPLPAQTQCVSVSQHNTPENVAVHAVPGRRFSQKRPQAQPPAIRPTDPAPLASNAAAHSEIPERNLHALFQECVTSVRGHCDGVKAKAVAEEDYKLASVAKQNCETLDGMAHVELHNRRHALQLLSSIEAMLSPQQRDQDDDKHKVDALRAAIMAMEDAQGRLHELFRVAHHALIDDWNKVKRSAVNEEQFDLAQTAKDNLASLHSLQTTLDDPQRDSAAFLATLQALRPAIPSTDADPSLEEIEALLQTQI